MIRHFVKPGVTGWAQVNGFRGEIKGDEQLQKRIEYDIWYLENWNLWLDTRIILMTAFNYDRDHIIKRSCLEGLQGVIFKKPVSPVLLKKLLLKQCRPERAAAEPSSAEATAGLTGSRKVG
jgi:hypothetical protein